jgi:hypothetical protein
MTDNTPITITGETFLRLTERAALADTLLLERDDLLTRIAMLRQEVAAEQARSARLAEALETLQGEPSRGYHLRDLANAARTALQEKP